MQLAALSSFTAGTMLSLVGHASAFTPSKATATTQATTALFSSVPSDVSSTSSLSLADLKTDLVRACTKEDKPGLNEIKMLVRDLEDKAEMVGEGQASSITGVMAGEWELLYSPEDVTRSSPFFWAFAQAFPDNSDQIFGITDAIPAPIKEVGPAYQTFDLAEGSSTGKLVSRVKVATLNGIATSVMTTRAEVTGAIGVDGLTIRIDTTKPEESTALKNLGPLGTLLNDNLPPFPSGEALEQVVPGSSTVVMRTTFCDDGLRISRNDAKYDEPYVWRRRKFSTSDTF
mmetsp:Transcript_471/g.986  ORF Transcript_471/g.986 Transcript_471/m.986 type:complete len:287 (+) Transcript_471:180-1040(+)|eukprot:CAMPEP_0201129774 /NCGR_PEP_ID=MMETSP0850-20130426/38015_1 /ASSEMBLY_ACC=CAM_ASM_000622 /TAXON_ID=183588 /ORGANISM="Pseudo-nitzschia fraudulenta, Strain WWA7" /LENGTH=286 /DNA_ID=CAMNT_0047399351 /DNA_START=178 /DNA_END=1038 /DNA_ORIENTATION=+